MPRWRNRQTRLVQTQFSEIWSGGSSPLLGTMRDKKMINIEVDPKEVKAFLHGAMHKCNWCGVHGPPAGLATRVACVDESCKLGEGPNRYFCDYCSFDNWRTSDIMDFCGWHDLKEDKIIVDNSIKVLRWEDLSYADFVRKLVEIKDL